MSPNETLVLLVQAGLYDTAFSVASAFALPLTSIFDGLAARCVFDQCLRLVCWRFMLGLTKFFSIKKKKFRLKCFFFSIEKFIFLLFSVLYFLRSGDNT